MLVVRVFFGLLFPLIVIAITAPVALVVFGAQSEPLVHPTKSMDQTDVARAKALLRQHDPRRLRDGETRTINASERDVNLLLQHALPFAERQRSSVDLADGSAIIRYTLSLPDNPVGNYLNLTLRIVEESESLSVQGVRVGSLTVPGWMVNPLVVAANSVLSRLFDDYRGVMETLRGVVLQTDRVRVTYRWQSDLADRMKEQGRTLLLSTADRERILAYDREIKKQSESLAGKVSVSRMLQPLFLLAMQRSANGADAAAENRALFLALGTAVSGSSIASVVGDPAVGLPTRPRRLSLTLRGRGDLAKHFAISAALAAVGGRSLADAVGVFKELDDSRGGSGFSFADLLADRAGAQLATVALGEGAAQIQRRLAGRLRESDFMPSIDQLPEGLIEMQFRSRYKDLDDPAYGRVKREIESRIAMCRVYRGV